MKRCPDCGFRANDTVCPLCGVRMRDLPGAARELNTHTHRQVGEECVLPNQKRERNPVEYRSPATAERKTREKNFKSTVRISPKVWQSILIVLIAILFRACAA